MQIPIVSGIYTDNGPDLRTAYPVNFFVTPKGSGISDSYLRPADGLPPEPPTGETPEHPRVRSRTPSHPTAAPEHEPQPTVRTRQTAEARDLLRAERVRPSVGGAQRRFARPRAGRRRRREVLE